MPRGTAHSKAARTRRMGARRLARLEARLGRLKAQHGPPPEWTRADWDTLAADGLAAAAEVRHQWWLLEQWRDLARGEAETGP